MKKQCGNCKFWDRMVDPDYPTLDQNGWCRRYAPRPRFSYAHDEYQEDPTTCWPVTHEEQFCFEYEVRPQ